MISIIRWLIGFVKFRFYGGFNDGFINSCYEAGEPVRNLCIDGDCLVGECPASHYLSLSRIARQHGGRLRVIKRRGIVFPFLKIKNRLGIFVGAVLFVVILSVLSGFVWEVEVVGNERIDEAELLQFLDENGLHSGVFWDNVEKDRVENLVMASFDDCAWVHINELGTTARVEINETRENADAPVSKKPANLKATDDGVIVKATVYDGWQAAKKGDSVTKGDLLISGVYDSEKKKGNQFAHARGEYIAQVTVPVKCSVSRIQSRQSYTDTYEYKTLLFYGLRIPLYIGRANTQNADVTENAEYVKIHSNRIPVGILTETVRRYNVEQETLSDKELYSLCQKEMEKKIQSELSDCEIVKEKIDVTLNADTAEAKGKVIALKDIGEEVEIKIKKTKK